MDDETGTPWWVFALVIGILALVVVVLLLAIFFGFRAYRNRKQKEVPYSITYVLPHTSLIADSFITIREGFWMTNC